MNILKIMQTTLAGTMLMVLGLSSATAFATVRHVVWDKNFIHIQIPIGQEKIIEFCAPESIGTCQTIGFKPAIPSALLDSGQLHYIGANGALYLKATAPFSQQLMQVNLDNAAGDTVFLRLTATPTADDDRIEVLLPGHQAVSPMDLHEGGRPTEDKSIGDMVRWVAKQLYAPERLLTEPNWIYRVPMHTAHFVALYRGGVVSAMPLASWQAGDYYVTAVLLRNVLPQQEVFLDPELLRGTWIASAFFRLTPLSPQIVTQAATATDSTTVILVSAVPFDVALNGGGHNV